MSKFEVLAFEDLGGALVVDCFFEIKVHFLRSKLIIFLRSVYFLRIWGDFLTLLVTFQKSIPATLFILAVLLFS